MPDVMPIVLQQIDLDIVPGKIPPIVHVSEYDTGRQILVNLFRDGYPFGSNSIESYTVKVEGSIGKYGFSENAAWADDAEGVVVVHLTEAMTAIHGRVWTKIKLIKSESMQISTCGFWMDVDRAGVNAQDVIQAQGFTEQIAAAAGAWLEDQGFTSPTIDVTQITGGHRVTVTDYEGSESFDVMDGEDTGVEVDATLSVAGKAADAKVVGDALYDTVQIDATLWRAYLGNNTTSLYLDSDSIIYVFNCNENSELAVVVTGNKNRFRILGSAEIIDVSDPKNLTGLTTIYNNNNDSSYQFNTGSYKTIFVYVVADDATLSPTISISGRAIIFKEQIAQKVTLPANGQENQPLVSDGNGGIKWGSSAPDGATIQDIFNASLYVDNIYLDYSTFSAPPFVATQNVGSSLIVPLNNGASYKIIRGDLPRFRAAVFNGIPNASTNRTPVDTLQHSENQGATELEYECTHDGYYLMVYGNNDSTKRVFQIIETVPEETPNYIVMPTGGQDNQPLVSDGQGGVKWGSASGGGDSGGGGSGETGNVYSESLYADNVYLEYGGVPPSSAEFRSLNNASTLILPLEKGASYTINKGHLPRFRASVFNGEPNASTNKTPVTVLQYYEGQGETTLTYECNHTGYYLAVYGNNDGQHRAFEILKTGGSGGGSGDDSGGGGSATSNRVLLGSPQVHLSDATASVETSLNSKTVSELYAIYDELCANYPQYIKRGADLGTDANGNEIRQYIVSFDKPYTVTGEVSLSGVLPASTPNLWDSDFNNPTILINTGCHGNEKAPTWGVALAIKELVESDEEWALFIKSNFTLKILPCMNPYGFTNNVRRNANNTDLNRDCINFTQAESQAWKSFIDANTDALFYLDFHGTSGYYAYFESLTESSDSNYPKYAQTYLKFATAVEKNWKAYWAFSANVIPHCLYVNSTYTGMTLSYTASIGMPGHVLETPQDASHGNTQSWGNDLRACKITKDFLINIVQAYAVIFG